MTTRTQKIKDDLSRLRRYDEELTKVMPPDFKDWHQNSKEEWPEIAAAVIVSLREREQLAWEQVDFAYEELQNRS